MQSNLSNSTIQQNLIGSVVKKKRIELGLSQINFSAQLQVKGWDISRSGLAKIESKLRRVNDAELYILAQVLDCELVDLYPPNLSDITQVLRQGHS